MLHQETGSNKQKEEDWMLVDEDKVKDQSDAATSSSQQGSSSGFMPDLQGASPPKGKQSLVLLLAGLSIALRCTLTRTHNSEGIQQKYIAY